VSHVKQWLAPFPPLQSLLQDVAGDNELVRPVDVAKPAAHDVQPLDVASEHVKHEASQAEQEPSLFLIGCVVLQVTQSVDAVPLHVRQFPVQAEHDPALLPPVNGACVDGQDRQLLLELPLHVAQLLAEQPVDVQVVHVPVTASHASQKSGHTKQAPTKA
jgi:hypothetical protein